MRKTQYYGICVISRIGGGVIGMACTVKIAQVLPRQTSRIIDNQEIRTYWFNTFLEAQAFYDKTWVEMKRTA